MNDVLIGPALNRPGSDEACARCRKPIDDPTNAIEAQRPRKIGRRTVQGTELVCMACWWNPGGPKPEQPKPAQTLPYKTLAEANARAEQIGAHFGRPVADIWGNADTGYRVFGDSPAVPGYKKPAA